MSTSSWLWLVVLGLYKSGMRVIVPGDYLVNLLPGACLLLALRAALTGTPWPWIAALLLASLLAHWQEIWRRSVAS